MATRILISIFACVCLAAGQDQPQASAGTPAGYHIGAGDVLQITVWKEPDASVPSIVVRPDGKISMPVIKEIDVAGLTPAETEKLLAGKLERFIHGAEVTVIVREVRSKKVYLAGGVRKEGPLLLNSQITVLQAINEAGGLTEYAKKKKIYVLRNVNGKAQRLPFDYDAVLKGERLEQNIPVEPGDTIVVPQ